MNKVTIPSAAAAAAAQATGASDAKKPQPLLWGEIVAAATLIVVGIAILGATLYGFSSGDRHFIFKGKEVTTTEPASQGASSSGSPTKPGSPAASTTTTGATSPETTTTIANTTTSGTTTTQSGVAGTTTAESNPGADSPKSPSNSTSGTSGKQTTEIDYSDTVAVFALTIGAALILGGGFYGRLRSLKLGGLELGLVGDEEKKQAADTAAQKVEEKAPNLDDDKKQAAKAAAQQVAVADLGKAAALGIDPTNSTVIEGIAEQAAQKVASAMS